MRRRGAAGEPIMTEPMSRAERGRLEYLMKRHEHVGAERKAARDIQRGVSVGHDATDQKLARKRVAAAEAKFEESVSDLQNF